MIEVRPFYRYLEQIRAGQPVPELLPVFSPHVQDILEWIEEQRQRKASFFRLVEGEFGFGKTTFARLLCDREMTSGKGFMTSLGVRSSFQEKLIIANWLFRAEPKALLGSLILAAKQHEDSLPITLPMDPTWRPLYLAVYALARGRVSMRDIVPLLLRWILEDRISDLKVMLSGFVGEPVTVPILGDRVMEGFFDAVATIFGRSNEYPLLILDEVESIALLYNSNSGKERAAQRIREWMDYLFAREESRPGHIGFLGLITHEGMETIYQYAAASDRLASPEDFLTPEHVLWRMRHLGAWDNPRAILDFLMGCYEADDATSTGRKTAAALHDMRPEVKDLCLQTLGDSHVAPRQKLKMVVCEILDRHLSPEAMQVLLERIQANTIPGENDVPVSVGEAVEEGSHLREDGAQSDGCGISALWVPADDVPVDEEEAVRVIPIADELDHIDYAAICEANRPAMEYSLKSMGISPPDKDHQKMLNPLTQRPFFIPKAAQKFSFSMIEYIGSEYDQIGKASNKGNWLLRKDNVPVTASAQGAWFGGMLCWYSASRIASLLPLSGESLSNRLSSDDALSFLKRWLTELRATHDGATYLGFAVNKERDSSVTNDWEKLPLEKVRAPLPKTFSALRCLAWSVLFQIMKLQTALSWNDLQADVDNLLLDDFNLREKLRMLPRTGLIIQQKRGFHLFSGNKRIADISIEWIPDAFYGS